MRAKVSVLFVDQQVVGVFQDPEWLDIAKKLFYSDDVAEFELDLIPPHPPGLVPWAVEMKPNGDVTRVYRKSLDDYEIHELSRGECRSAEFQFREEKYHIFWLWAKNQVEAIETAVRKHLELIRSVAK